MRRKYLYIIAFCLLCCAAGLTSCTDESPVAPPAEKENAVYLAFRAAVAGASTRADGTEEPDEVIKRLQIVIVSQKTGDGAEGSTGTTSGWTVEENRVISSGSSYGILLSDEHTFKVEAGCRKRIYLLANCNGLKDAKGAPLSFANEAFLPDESNGTAAIDSYVFALGTETGSYQYATALNEGNGIPMTAMYEVDIPERSAIPENYIEDDFYTEIPQTLYVVRAATKFTFSFRYQPKEGNEEREIAVTGISLKKVIEDRMYLMPHVQTGTDGKYWVVDAAREQHTHLPKETGTASAGTGVDWIDWMVEEAKKEAPSGDAQKYEWLTAYKVPNAEEGKEETVEFSYQPDGDTEIKVPKQSEYPTTPALAFYLPESKTVKAAETADDLLLQEYEVTIHTKENLKPKDDGWNENDYSSVTREYHSVLLHLASLFRNTHVKVRVTFKDDSDYKLDWEVDVEPYWSVVLDPVFGLDEKADPKKR